MNKSKLIAESVELSIDNSEVYSLAELSLSILRGRKTN